ncbi:MAG: hypothetical protein ACI4EV_02695 [Lachnospiraceae bacterium]
MNDETQTYNSGYYDGRQEVFCSLLCYGFDEKYLQRLFSIDDDELQIIISKSNARIAAIKRI